MYSVDWAVRFVECAPLVQYPFKPPFRSITVIRLFKLVSPQLWIDFSNTHCCYGQCSCCCPILVLCLRRVLLCPSIASLSGNLPQFLLLIFSSISSVLRILPVFEVMIVFLCYNFAAVVAFLLSSFRIWPNYEVESFSHNICGYKKICLRSSLIPTPSCIVHFLC